MALISTACHKPSADNQGASGGSSADAGAPPSPRGLGLVSDGAGTVVITNAESTAATLSELSQALRQYVIRTRTVPKDFQDFAAKTQLQAPAPPAGKRYAIKGQAVVLVNQ